MKWTDEHDATLRRLHAEGHSFTFIAARIGGITRNSAIGRANRLGLPSRMLVAVKTNHQRKSTKRKARETRNKSNWASTASKVRPAALICDGLPLPTPAEFDVARVSFNDLDRHHCRFPCLADVAGVPQDQPMFCGLKPIPGLPYCATHSRRAFDPVQLRRREIRVSQERVVQVA